MAKKSVDFNRAWVNIFDRYNLLNTVKLFGYVDITAEQIKAVDGKEPRLLTKIDFRENLPEIMQNEQLSILAIKNGLYRIAKNDPFIDLNEELPNQIIEVTAPNNILTLDPFNVKSESGALDIAYIAGICREVFEEDTFLTIRGRLRGNLDFNINQVPYNINGVQIEVDGGYEGFYGVHIIEAKIGFRNNINIRQLLYPQLYWQNRPGYAKQVKTYIFYLHNDIFRFIPYIYDGNIGYADHTQEKAFRFVKPSNPNYSIYSIPINNFMVNTNVPFPQADKFEKVMDMLFVIARSNGCLSKQELNLEFDLVSRQIDYYLNVLKWLMVCEEKNGCIVLTERGKFIVELPFKERLWELAKIVFAEPIFNNILHQRTIDNLFFRYGVKSQSTQNRRLQTVNAWISYFKRFLQ